MAEPTPNWGIPQLDSNSPLTPIQSPFNAMAMALDGALTSLGYRRGTAAERAAWTDAPERAVFIETDTGRRYERISGAWKNRTIARAQLTSSTGTTNGTVTLSWTDSVSDSFHQEGGTFWTSGQATRIVAPYAGWYRVFVSFRTTGVNPVTLTPSRTGVALPYAVSSASGVSGAATNGGRSFDVQMAAGDYLTFAAASNAGSAGSHSIQIEYLGEP